MYFAYNGVCEVNGYTTTYEPSGDPPAYSAGFVDKNKDIRDINAYGQNKWNLYKRYNRLLEKWGPYIMSFEDNERRSYIYRKPEERSQMLFDGQFMNEVFTYKPNIDGSASAVSDPINDRFLQISFFTKHPWILPYTNPKSQYFMVTNRRCSPYYNNSSDDNIGGKRNVKVRISPFSLGFQKFRNVSLLDLGRDSILTTFYNENNINSNYTLDLGWFNPGEAKLFKIAPALSVGGTLVANEDIYNEEFTCDGQVNTNGKEVLFGDSTIINFSPSGNITVNGGTFACLANNYPAKFKGLNGQFWGGVKIDNASFGLINTVFENTSGQAIYGINSDVSLFDCIFNLNSRAIQFSNTGNTGKIAQIGNCKFNITNTTSTNCNFLGSAAGMVNLYIDGNEFNTTSGSIALNINSGFGTVKKQ